MSASDSDASSASEGSDPLVRWIEGDPKPRSTSGQLPPVRREPFDRGRHFDETGRWLAKAVTLVFGLCLAASWAAIAFKLGDSAAVDGWTRLVIPSLSSLIGAAFGFYFRSKLDSGV